MKVVLTGSTGFVGRAVLKQCCESSKLQSIIVLSRRSLSEGLNHPKIKTIIVQDFSSYTEEVLDAISDADGCIWCLGKASPDVEIAYPKAFVQAMTQNWSTRQKVFRHIYCSGVIAERDQEKPLWFLSDLRKAKGQAESELTEFATQSTQKGLWQTYIMRPSLILPENPSLVQKLAGYFIGSITVSGIANAAVSLLLDGSSKQTLENSDLVDLQR